MGNVTQRSFDAIELELLWRRLISLVDEAAAALVRTSFSTLVRESYDFSCIVTDDAGQSLVQATESIPSFIGTLPTPPHPPPPSRSSATAAWSPSAPPPRTHPTSAEKSAARNRARYSRKASR